MEAQTYVKTQISNAMKAEFLAAIADEYDGATDFFKRKIREQCNIKKSPPKAQTEEIKAGYTCLSVSVTPEQRAALLAQCQKEGKTMGTWMREQIKDYLASKKEQ